MKKQWYKVKFYFWWTLNNLSIEAWKEEQAITWHFEDEHLSYYNHLRWTFSQLWTMLKCKHEWVRSEDGTYCTKCGQF